MWGNCFSGGVANTSVSGSTQWLTLFFFFDLHPRIERSEIGVARLPPQGLADLSLHSKCGNPRRNRRSDHEEDEEENFEILMGSRHAIG